LARLARMGLKARPDYVGLYHALATLLVAENDVEAYRHACTDMMSRFAGTTNASTADVVAKDCLILPSSGVDTASVAILAEIAVARGKGEVPYTFYLCVAQATSHYSRRITCFVTSVFRMHDISTILRHSS
jgi:hypothetical protein